VSGVARRALRNLGQSLSLAAWRRPDAPPELAGFGGFLLACLLSLAAFFVQDQGLTDAPATAYVDNLYQHTTYFLALLVGAWIAARVLSRPVLWLPLATFAVLVGTVWNALSLWVLMGWLVDSDELRQGAWKVLLALGGFVALYQTVRYLSAASSASLRLAATLVFVAVLAAPWYVQQEAWFWFPPETADAADGSDVDDAGDQPVAGDAEGEDAPAPVLGPSIDLERLMGAQPARVQAAVEQVRAQTPGRIDLFAVGFAGDGAERVFRNEVEYFQRLAAQRFGARGRTLALVNSPATLRDAPLATLANLRDALAGVAARMDPEEDVLMLFLTSHGHRDHRLYVGLSPLPLRQVTPSDLRSALDDAGIRWRVVVVSACYSGGFVDALRDTRTLVITASRADRTSFGCGSDSNITWFGKAYLAEAMNQTTDFERGFDLAAHRIREWELRDAETPSIPQIAAGAALRRHLAAWRGGLPPAAAVPFVAPPRDGRVAAAASPEVPRNATQGAASTSE
jgi:hypothetical protein